MTVHRDRTHHHPRVWRTITGRVWLARCTTCGWWTNSRVWHVALIRALDHSQEVSS